MGKISSIKPMPELKLPRLPRGRSPKAPSGLTFKQDAFCQHVASGCNLSDAYARWLEAEKLYYATPDDISDKLAFQITDKQHPLESTLATTPADTWAGVRCKIDWLEHKTNIHFVSTGKGHDVLKSTFADVVRLSV